VHCPGEGASGDPEELGQEVLCAEFAQVEDGGQDPIGGGEGVLGACSSSAASLAAAPLVAVVFALLRQGDGQFAGQGVQTAAGHAGELGVAECGGTGWLRCGLARWRRDWCGRRLLLVGSRGVEGVVPVCAHQLGHRAQKETSG
jgi:hypothetical protein